jgi:hypothetical protein
MYNLDNLPMKVTSMHYDKRTSLLFLGLSEKAPKDSTMNSLNNIINLFKTPASTEGTGALLIYNIIKNNSGEQHFEPLYSKELYSEVSYVNYFNSNSVLAAGLNNGSVLLFKIYINETSDISKDLVEELCVVKAHKKRIIGVAVNFIKGYVYTVARDGVINISEINYQSIMRNIKISKKEFSRCVFEEKKNRLFLTDEGGSIWIVDMSDSVSMCYLYF